MVGAELSNFNGAAVEVWELINNIIPHLMLDVIADHAWITVIPC